MARRPDLERREALLAAIEQIVIEEGFAHLRVGSLAERLKCGRTTLYKLAPTKDELMLLVYRRLAARARLARDSAAAAGPTYARKLTSYIDAALRSDRAVGANLLADLSAWPPMLELHLKEIDHAVQTVTGMIDCGIASGEFRVVDSRLVAALVWESAVAVRRPGFLESSSLVADEADREIAELFVSSLTNLGCVQQA